MNITNEDNMELMARYPDKYFDLAIVDPPYGIDRFQKNVECKGRKRFNNKINEWDKKPNQKYFRELFRVSKNQIIWGANHFWCVDNFYSLPNCSHFIFWDKLQPVSNFAGGEMAWTSFNGVATKFQYAWGGLSDGILGRNKTEKNIHPTQKPVKLYEWLLDNYAKEGDKILDTHLGSGSIAIACHNRKFDLTACELDKEYFDAAMKRIEAHKRQLTIF